MLATKPAFLQNSKAAKMFKAKVLPTYCSHKVDPINGPGAQEYRVSQKTHFQNALGAIVYWLNHKYTAPLVSEN